MLAAFDRWSNARQFDYFHALGALLADIKLFVKQSDDSAWQKVVVPINDVYSISPFLSIWQSPGSRIELKGEVVVEEVHPNAEALFLPLNVPQFLATQARQGCVVVSRSWFDMLYSFVALSGRLPEAPRNLYAVDKSLLVPAPMQYVLELNSDVAVCTSSLWPADGSTKAFEAELLAPIVSLRPENRLTTLRMHIWHYVSHLVAFCF